ncbi:MAG: hypothetical protein AAGF12_25135 [Myxococcota bacterium]
MKRRIHLCSMAMLAAPLLASCTPELREGFYSCSTDSDCPSDWSCSPDTRRCFSVRQTSDGGVDARNDAPTDSLPPDALPDATGDGDAGSCTPPPVDLLMVIDNSNTMEEEQMELRNRFPDFVLSLFRGDIDLDGTSDVPGIEDLRAAVVTTDLGAGGFRVGTCDTEFGDDGVLQTTSGGNDCPAMLPSFIQFDPDNVSSQREDFGCLSTPGLDGCGFEQPLEAALKAVTPSTSSLEFFRGTKGQADQANAGFFRPDSLLIVVIVTDEEDCSASEPDLFNFMSTTYTAEPNLRCTTDWGDDDPLHEIARYADGFRATRSTPDRFILGVLAGIPPDVEDAPFDTILTDSRMQYVETMDMVLRPACQSPLGNAVPGRRFVEAAQELTLTGSAAVLGSICTLTFDGFIARLLAAAAPVITCGQ